MLWKVSSFCFSKLQSFSLQAAPNRVTICKFWSQFPDTKGWFSHQIELYWEALVPYQMYQIWDTISEPGNFRKVPPCVFVGWGGTLHQGRGLSWWSRCSPRDGSVAVDCTDMVLETLGEPLVAIKATGGRSCSRSNHYSVTYWPLDQHPRLHLPTFCFIHVC